MAAAGGGGRRSTIELGEELFWFAAAGRDVYKWNIFAGLPWLKDALRGPLWTQGLRDAVVVPAFAAAVAVLLWGPQDRAHNAVLTFFWGGWWPLSFLAFPALGRVWCAVCPFMAYGDLVQRWRLATGAVLQKWPKAGLTEYGPWFLLALFTAILVWEEAWDLPDTAALSGWLLILITAGAVAGSAVFERRVWCRYLCPIGGMEGLFAKLAMTELRGRHGVCAGSCSTYSCYKGGPATPPEGLPTSGCPLSSHPAQLADNKDCVLCMECLKACPHASIELRLRPPGADLYSPEGHTGASAPEASLMFLLLGAVYAHSLTPLLRQFGAEPLALSPTWESPGDPVHCAVAGAVMAAPALLALAADVASRRLGAAGAAPPAPFVTLSYAYLSLVWGGTLAHYEGLMFTELGRILPIAAATAGLGDPSLAGGGLGLWEFVVDPAVGRFLQGCSLAVGGVGSLLLLRATANTGWRQILPHAALVGLLTAEMARLILP